jgi:hypothetical protein
MRVETIDPKAQGSPRRALQGYRCRSDIQPRSERLRWAWALFKTGRAVRRA